MVPQQSTHATNVTKIDKNNGHISSGSSGVSNHSQSSKTNHADKHVSSESKSKKHSKLFEMLARKPQRTETETSSEKCRSIFETNGATPVRTETVATSTESHTFAARICTEPASADSNGRSEMEKQPDVSTLLQILQGESSAMTSTELAASEIIPSENENLVINPIQPTFIGNCHLPVSISTATIQHTDAE